MTDTQRIERLRAALQAVRQGVLSEIGCVAKECPDPSVKEAQDCITCYVTNLVDAALAADVAPVQEQVDGEEPKQ